MFNPRNILKGKKSDFNGIYRGVVVDNNDPQDAGRCRVRVYPMFAGVPDGDLPWATYADALMGGKSGRGGSFIPDTGALVFVFFENGDHEQPVYFAGAPAKENGTPQIASGTENVKKFVSRSGVEISISEDSERITISTPAGSEVDLDGDEVSISGNLLNIIIQGDVKIDASGNVEISGAMIHLNP